jgi:hypothetical protein
MRLLVGLTALFLLCACAATTASTPTPLPTPTATSSPLPSATPTTAVTPTSTPSPSPIASATASPSLPPSPSATASIAGELSPAEVRYLLIDQLGPLHYCDPDEYPVAHGDEQQQAIEQFPLIQADAPTFTAILMVAGLSGRTTFSDADKLQIYREWKVLNAVDAQPLGSGLYRFDVTTEGDAASGKATHYQGTVDAVSGQISVASQEEVFGVSCPICLARGTLIDTPTGPRPVDELAVGDLVWTVDALGERVASTVERVGSVPVPSTHKLVHLVLGDGRTLDVSPGHPLTDGRHAGELAAGAELDGSVVISAELVPYVGGRTYDVLPAGQTGFYWANGVLLASTLR